MSCLLKKVNLLVLTTIITLPVISAKASEAIPEEFEAALTHYRCSLPVIDLGSGDPIESISAFLLGMRAPNCPVENLEGLMGKLRCQYQSDQPMKMLLLGFPFKSTNRDLKCISAEVDLGEYLGLMTLQHLADQIGEIYKPGVHVTIVSDGLGYKTAIDESDDNIERYHTGITKLLAQFSSISFIGWKINETIQSIDQLRAQVSQVKVARSQEAQETMQDMKLFVAKEFKSAYWEAHFRALATEATLAECRAFEHPAPNAKAPKPGYLETRKTECINRELNRLRREKTLETTAALSDCSIKFGFFVSQNFPDYPTYLRLSVHPHKDVSQKLGIQLVQGQSGTPWHNAVVQDNGKFRYLDEKSKGKDQMIELTKVRTIMLNGLELKYLTK